MYNTTIKVRNKGEKKTVDFKGCCVVLLSIVCFEGHQNEVEVKVSRRLMCISNTIKRPINWGLKNRKTKKKERKKER